MKIKILFLLSLAGFISMNSTTLAKTDVNSIMPDHASDLPDADDPMGLKTLFAEPSDLSSNTFNINQNANEPDLSGLPALFQESNDPESDDAEMARRADIKKLNNNDNEPDLSGLPALFQESNDPESDDADISKLYQMINKKYGGLDSFIARIQDFAKKEEAKINEKKLTEENLELEKIKKEEDEKKLKSEMEKLQKENEKEEKDVSENKNKMEQDFDALAQEKRDIEKISHQIEENKALIQKEQPIEAPSESPKKQIISKLKEMNPAEQRDILNQLQDMLGLGNAERSMRPDDIALNHNMIPPEGDFEREPTEMLREPQEKLNIPPAPPLPKPALPQEKLNIPPAPPLPQEKKTKNDKQPSKLLKKSKLKKGISKEAPAKLQTP